MSEITLSADAGNLTIPNVELGNTYQIKSGQNEQSNIAGEIQLLRQSYWPIIYRLSFRFNKIKTCPSDLGIIQYLIDSLGQEVTLTDLDGVDWIGVIVTPQVELTSNHSDSIVIDFEGVLI